MYLPTIIWYKLPTHICTFNVYIYTHLPSFYLHIYIYTHLPLITSSRNHSFLDVLGHPCLFLDANFNWTEKAENIKTMRSSSHRSRILNIILTLLANSSDFLERLSWPPGTSKLGKSEDKLILWKYFIRLRSWVRNVFIHFYL